MNVNSLILVGIGVTMIAAGYLIYSRWLSQSIFKLSPRYKTPAHTMKDGVDYVPTNNYVLWGHHFTSVAGAAPITGPAIAVIWGWLPAFLWVTIGTVFIAGMHDLGTLWASQRHKGQSIGVLSGRYIGPRGRNLFLVVIFLLLLIVVAAFATVISGLLVSTPTAVIPTWGAILVAVAVGQAIYRFQWSLPLVSVVGVVALYSLIVIGDRFPITLPDEVLGLPAQGVWIIILFVYGSIASLLPVWVLLQPRDYINGLQLFIGLGILYGAVLLAAPTVVAPALNSNADAPSMFPLLFVTVACGAISGFHGIVSSGTTSKQLAKEPDARFVGYFGAVGEGLLAVGALIAVSAGFKTLADWEAVYTAFNEGGIGAFVTSGGSLINEGLGIPASLSATILATMTILFAATTLDTAMRLKRLVIQEIAEIMGLRVGGLLATSIAFVLALTLTFSAGADGSGGMTLWPLMGTTNQILAALSLTIVSVVLLYLKRPVWPVLLPAIFVMTVSTWALLIQIRDMFESGAWLLLALNVTVLVASIWVIIEAIAALRVAASAPKITWSDDDTDAPSPQMVNATTAR